MSPLPARTIVLAVAIAIVITAVVAGLMVAGSPAEERRRRLDERRVADLRDLSSAVHGFARTEGRLPASLDELEKRPERTGVVRDPETGTPYLYVAWEGLKYELCAQFAGPTDEEQGRETSAPFWRHPAGPHCFALEAPSGKK